MKKRKLTAFILFLVLHCALLFSTGQLIKQITLGQYQKDFHKLYQFQHDDILLIIGTCPGYTRDYGLFVTLAFDMTNGNFLWKKYGMTEVYDSADKNYINAIVNFGTGAWTYERLDARTGETIWKNRIAVGANRSQTMFDNKGLVEGEGYIAIKDWWGFIKIFDSKTGKLLLDKNFMENNEKLFPFGITLEAINKGKLYLSGKGDTTVSGYFEIPVACFDIKKERFLWIKPVGFFGTIISAPMRFSGKKVIVPIQGGISTFGGYGKIMIFHSDTGEILDDFPIYEKVFSIHLKKNLLYYTDAHNLICYNLDTFRGQWYFNWDFHTQDSIRKEEEQVYFDMTQYYDDKILFTIDKTHDYLFHVVDFDGNYIWKGKKKDIAISRPVMVDNKIYYLKYYQKFVNGNAIMFYYIECADINSGKVAWNFQIDSIGHSEDFLFGYNLVIAENIAFYCTAVEDDRYRDQYYLNIINIDDTYKGTLPRSYKDRFSDNRELFDNIKPGDGIYARWNDNLWMPAVVGQKTAKGYLVFFDSLHEKIVPRAEIVKDIPPEEKNIRIGSTVIAQWKNGLFYPGTVSSINMTNYTITYFDGDQYDVTPGDIRLSAFTVKDYENKPGKDFVTGERVLADWYGDGGWTGGRIVKRTKKGYLVYLDADFEKDVALDKVIANQVPIQPEIYVDRQVLAKYSTMFLPAVITEIKKDRYYFEYYDGFKGSCKIYDLRLD